MREILFRGKRCDNGEWEFGNLIISPYFKDCVMIERRETKNGYHATLRINPESVGQYTGLKDKNGKRIFEDDIVRYRRHTGAINFTLGCFCIRAREKDMFGRSNPAIDIIVNEYPNEIEVIGNIHDNPDLVERSDHDGK